MLVESRLDDIMLTSAMTGLETNMLRPSIVAAGLDPGDLPAGIAAESSANLYGSRADAPPRRWKDMWSAGHSVSGIERVISVDELIATTAHEYAEARAQTRARLA
jgi:nitronate monooxygenase